MIPLEEVQALFHQRKPPAGFLAHLIRHEDGAYYAIRFYRSNFDKLTPMERVAAMHWANETFGIMNQLIQTVPEIWRTPEVK